MDFLPPLGLIGILGGFWGWHRYTERRFRAAVAEAAARFNGRYEPGSHTSGGTLFLKVDARDVVFAFDRGSSSSPPTTAVSIALTKPLASPVQVKGRDAVARAPRLAPYTRWSYGARLHAERRLVTVTVGGVVRDAAKLADLASIVLALAGELESATSTP